MNNDDAAFWFDESDAFEDCLVEPGICPACEGSGEGLFDGSTCSLCKGLGEL
ncbi:MAG: hypothetical protein KGZ88_12015 [Methylomicrobium sp.]|nr:hypothetical protein [Methylomicrobium sp.]